MIKLSSRMLYKNKDHTKLFFNGMQHEKMYKNGQLIWERGIGKKYIVVTGDDYKYLIYIDTKEYENLKKELDSEHLHHNNWNIYVYGSKIICNSKMCYLQATGIYKRENIYYEIAGVHSKNGKKWKMIPISALNYDVINYGESNIEALCTCDNRNNVIAPYYSDFSESSYEYINIMLFNVETGKNCNILKEKLGDKSYEVVYSDGEHIVYAYDNKKSAYSSTIYLQYLYINNEDISKSYFKEIGHIANNENDYFLCAMALKEKFFVLWYNSAKNQTYETVYNMYDGKVISSGKSNISILLRYPFDIYTGLYALNKFYLYVSPLSDNKQYVIETEDGINFKEIELPKTIKLYNIKSKKIKEVSVSEIVYGLNNLYDLSNITSASNAYFENNKLKGNIGHLVIQNYKKIIYYIDNMYFNESKNNFMFEVSDSKEQ